MYITTEKRDKQLKKLLERAEARTVELTAEQNLSIRQARFSFETSCYIVVTPKIAAARMGGGICISSYTPDDAKIPLAVYTPSRLLMLDEEKPFFVKKDVEVGDGEEFFLYFVTTEFSELMAVNGRYGEDCIFRMYPPEQFDISYQIAMMLLCSYSSPDIPELLEWLNQRVELETYGDDSDGD